jgi:hypothetical protein
MLIKSVYDLIRAFVVAACKHLVTVVTVENQHINYPPVHLLALPTQYVNLLLGSLTKQNNALNRMCLDIRRHSIDTWQGAGHYLENPAKSAYSLEFSGGVWEPRYCVIERPGCHAQPVPQAVELLTSVKTRIR